MTENIDRSVFAVHLAAGQGTRLRPLTDDRPKPLVEVGGTSMLERNIETLENSGVQKQLVVTGYRADQIQERGYETVHNDRYDETDMVYSLFCARDAFSADRDLLISSGDIVYDHRLVDALLSCEAPLCVVVDEAWQSLWEARFSDPLDDAETLDITEDGHIQEIGNEPERLDGIDAQYVGLLKVGMEYLDQFVETYETLSQSTSHGVEETPVRVEMTHFIQQLIDDGWNVKAVPVKGGWIEVDTVDDLSLYHEWLDAGVMADRRNLQL